VQNYNKILLVQHFSDNFLFLSKYMFLGWWYSCKYLLPQFSYHKRFKHPTRNHFANMPQKKKICWSIIW